MPELLHFQLKAVQLPTCLWPSWNSCRSITIFPRNCSSVANSACPSWPCRWLNLNDLRESFPTSMVLWFQDWSWICRSALWWLLKNVGWMPGPRNCCFPDTQMQQVHVEATVPACRSNQKWVWPSIPHAHRNIRRTLLKSVWLSVHIPPPEPKDRSTDSPVLFSLWMIRIRFH